MSNNIRMAGKLVKLAKEIISSNDNIADKEGKHENFTGEIYFTDKGDKISWIIEKCTFSIIL